MDVHSFTDSFFFLSSGMFAATTAASTLKEHLNPSECDVQVHVYESTSKLMSKVLISGGGRCNVLHDTTKPLPKILDSYPRGSRELNGLYSKHFTPDDALEWFVSRGVVLKTESDGRMFPVTDSSQTIADCIYDDAMKNGVIVKKGDRVAEIQTLDVNDDDDDNNKCILFDVVTQTREKGEKEQEGHNLYDSIIMATGSAPKGHGIIEQMNVGHTIVQPVPSLFTFNAAKSQIKDHDGVLYDLSGLSLQNAKLSLKVSGEC
jgi:predicted flavoprotein YhiN